MANRIGAGSLVCMGRRNVKGQGIVLDRIKDVNEHAQFDLVDAWHKLYNDQIILTICSKARRTTVFLWSLRTDAIKEIRESISRTILK